MINGFCVVRGFHAIILAKSQIILELTDFFCEVENGAPPCRMMRKFCRMIRPVG